jgi:hypothetical protein
MEEDFLTLNQDNNETYKFLSVIIPYERAFVL